MARKQWGNKKEHTENHRNKEGREEGHLPTQVDPTGNGKIGTLEHEKVWQSKRDTIE